MSLLSLCCCCFCWDGRMRDFVCKVWCPSQCPHIVAFYITVQFLSELSVALGTHSLFRRSRQHNAPYDAGGCHTSSLCFVFLCVFLGALLGSGTCVKGAPRVTNLARFLPLLLLHLLLHLPRLHLPLLPLVSLLGSCLLRLRDIRRPTMVRTHLEGSSWHTPMRFMRMGSNRF